MDAQKFDTITRMIARKVNRRGAVAFGSMGLGAALLGRQASAS